MMRRASRIGGRTESRRDWAVYEYVAALSESNAHQVGTGWNEESTAKTPRQAAGEMIGAGYLGLCLLADCLMDGRTRRFYKAMTPERGMSAGLWLADSFLDELAGPRATGAAQQARVTLSEQFPLGPVAQASKSEMEYERLDLTLLAVGMVLGEKPTRNLRFVKKFKPMEPEAILNTALLADAWTRGTRAMFHLVDPDGCQKWEESTNRSEA